MDRFEEEGKRNMKEESHITTLVSNRCVDVRGRVPDKRTTGGWKAAPFIIVNEVTERIAFFAVAVSMVRFLVEEMHQTIPSAATYVSDWIGAAYILTILGAFLADAYLGRFNTLVIFSSMYTLGMVLLTVQASIDSLRPPPCTVITCNTKATSSQNFFLFVALGLIALGTGGIKPCVSSFGADQFDEADQKEAQKKYAFFNWFFFAINVGAILALTVLVYLQEKKGWTWGFAVPTVAIACSVVILAIGMPYYRYKNPMGSPLTRFLQVIVAAVRNHFKGVQLRRDTDLYEVKTEESAIFDARKLAHTAQHRFWDKAAVITDPEASTVNSRWRLCTVTQVEEFKCFLRVLPVWASTIALAISFSQVSTFFISQAIIMDRNLGPKFEIPSGSIPIFTAINGLILVPIYETWMVPLLRKRTGHHRGITSLQRMGVGLFVSIFAMASAAVIEKRRREHSKPLTVSVFVLFPQFFLIGTAEVFTYVGQLEFFYDEATDGTRSISSALFLSEIGIGSWLSTAIVKIVEAATGGEDKGWLRNNLNHSRLENFYWLLTAINAVNFLVFVWVACHYKGRDAVDRTVI